MLANHVVRHNTQGNRKTKSSGWKQQGWRLQSGKPVKNQTGFKELDRVQNNLQVKWNYVEGHRGVHGNEMANKLAKAGANKYNKW